MRDIAERIAQKENIRFGDEPAFQNNLTFIKHLDFKRLGSEKRICEEALYNAIVSVKKASSEFDNIYRRNVDKLEAFLDAQIIKPFADRLFSEI